MRTHKRLSENVEAWDARGVKKKKNLDHFPAQQLFISPARLRTLVLDFDHIASWKAEYSI